MRKYQYKYHIWNSNWYKKNITQTGATWVEATVNDSDKPVETKAKAKKKELKLENFFPWWRQAR